MITRTASAVKNQYKLKDLILQIQIDGGCRNGWFILLWDTVSLLKHYTGNETRILLEIIKKTFIVSPC